MNKQYNDNQVPKVDKKIQKAQKINCITKMKPLVKEYKIQNQIIKFIQQYALDAQDVNKINFSDNKLSENQLCQIRKEMNDKIEQQLASLMKFKDYQTFQFIIDIIKQLDEPFHQFQKLSHEKSPQLLLAIYQNFMKIHNILQFFEDYTDQLINLYYNLQLIDLRLIILKLQGQLNNISRQVVELLQPINDKLPKSQVEVVNTQREEMRRQISQIIQIQSTLNKEIIQLKEQEYSIGVDLQNCIISKDTQTQQIKKGQLEEILFQVDEKAKRISQLKQQKQLLQTQFEQTSPQALKLQDQKNQLKPRINEYQRQYMQILKQKEEFDQLFLKIVNQKELYNQTIESYKDKIKQILNQQTITINYNNGNLVFKEFAANEIYICYFSEDSTSHLENLIQCHHKIVETFIKSNQLSNVQSNVIALDKNNLNDIEEFYEKKNKLDIQIIQLYLTQKQRIQKETHN